jgi:thiol-disulfide isomerase/thioredoxin
VNHLKFSKVLNAPDTSYSFSPLKNGLTIIDFFGTWCAPCLKALPRLTSLQQKHKNNLQVILVSVEQESRLTAFLSKQNNFPFPVVVDEGEELTALFQPPSLPYTVVISGLGYIVAITEGALIDDSKIAEWLKPNSETFIPTPLNPASATPGPLQSTSVMYSSNSTIRLSQDFIYAAKTSNGAAAFIGQLKKMSYKSLRNDLQTDADKKAFWINLYNGYTQVLLKEDSSRYKDRSSFFTLRQIEVAGKKFSLDDIEHGILRRSKIKWSLGYFNQLFPAKTEKELRVGTVDYRIHFALNCGAKSCPPIAYYSPENLNAQLNLATKAYLTSEVVYEAEKNRLYLPAIMGWFRADFSGKKGMKDILKKHLIIPHDANPGITFNKYDWTLYLDNYQLQNPG